MTDRDDIRAPEGAIPAGGEATTIHNAALEPIKAHRSLWKDVWIQFRSHKGAVVGTFVFLFIVLGTIFGPFFHTTDPTYIDYRAKNSQHMFSCFFFSVPETVEGRVSLDDKELPFGSRGLHRDDRQADQGELGSSAWHRQLRA